MPRVFTKKESNFAELSSLNVSTTCCPSSSFCQDSTYRFNTKALHASLRIGPTYFVSVYHEPSGKKIIVPNLNDVEKYVLF